MKNDELLALMRATPDGVLSVELRRMLGLGKKSRHKRLARLKAMGLLTSISLSIYARWCAVEHVATATEADRQYRKQVSDAGIEKRREYERSRLHDPRRRAMRNALNKQRDRSGERKTARKSPTPVVVDDSDRWPVVQRVVPANEAPPMRKYGPASVWELAA